MDSVHPCLAAIKHTIPQLLRENLVGIYLHGSYALEDFDYDRSDLDYLIVVKVPLKLSEKEALMKLTMEKLWTLAPAKKLEFHVLLQTDLQDWTTSNRFDFHFSPYHLAAYLKDPRTFCLKMNGLDQDLWTHIPVTKTCGVTLVGAKKEQSFPDIPEAIYWNSILADIATAETEILKNPVYTILNLCRSLAFLKDKCILSKRAGGYWALLHTSTLNPAVIQAALDAHTKSRAFPQNFSQQELENFALSSLKQISSLSHKGGTP
ncbi:aminoglycoside adenylyltransferase domain-containing protein [Streptococcus pneumoniae]